MQTLDQPGEPLVQVARARGWAIPVKDELAVSATLGEVNRLYAKHNPEKLADVPTLAAKFGEEKLLRMVRKKYKEQEAGGADWLADSAAFLAGSAALAEVNRLYGKYNPEKLDDVPTLVAKYGEVN